MALMEGADAPGRGISPESGTLSSWKKPDTESCSLCLIAADCSGTKRKVTQGQNSLLGLLQLLAPACSLMLSPPPQTGTRNQHHPPSTLNTKTILAVFRDQGGDPRNIYHPIPPCLRQITGLRRSASKQETNNRDW